MTRTIAKTIFSYDELSEVSKEKAYNFWYNSNIYKDYPSRWELNDLLKILELDNIRLDSWEYDETSYDFNVVDFFDDEKHLSEYVGLAGTKKAMKLFYAMTEVIPCWQVGSLLNPKDGKPFRTDLFYAKNTGKGESKGAKVKTEYRKFETGYNKKYNGMNVATWQIHTKTYTNGNSSRYIELPNARYMPQKDMYIDGTWLGAEFTHAFWDSIKLNHDISAYEHIKNAFDEMFASVVREVEYQNSREVFEDTWAYECEYYENGEVYNNEGE